QLIFHGNSRELEKIERAVHCFKGKTPSFPGTPHFVTYSIHPERHVGICDALQGTAPNSPISRSEAARTKCSNSFFPRDIGFQCSDGRGSHLFPVRNSS